MGQTFKETAPVIYQEHSNEREVVESLIGDLKELTEFYLASYQFKWNGKQVIRRAMAARLDRLTFDGFGNRFPVVINDNRKTK